MTSVTQIEEAVAGLDERDLASFRRWFEAFDAERFDRRIEGDASSGRLDRLADEALSDLAAGHTREL